MAKNRMVMYKIETDGSKNTENNTQIVLNNNDNQQGNVSRSWCCCSWLQKLFVPDGDDVNRIVNNNILDPNRMIKILVLGPGGSGKSTVLKQMRRFHGKSFEKSENQRFIRSIIINILDCVCSLVEAMSNFNINFINKQNTKNYNYLLDVRDELTGNIFDWAGNKATFAECVKRIWNDESVQKCYKMRNKFYLHDSCEYFMDNIDRIAAYDYLPTIDDILRVREPTTAIVEHRIKIKDTHFLFVDVGGQRSERKKWIHCFDSVTTVLFVASLSDYDLTLTADETRDFKTPNKKQNRLHEAIDLFKLLINWKVTVYNKKNSNNNQRRESQTKELLFKKSNLVLFLNKTDLFNDKIKYSPLSQCFSDFDDRKYNDNERAAVAKEFIANKFNECNEDRRKLIYQHFTYALDGESMKVVIQAVKDKIIEQMLKDIYM